MAACGGASDDPVAAPSSAPSSATSEPEATQSGLVLEGELIADQETIDACVAEGSQINFTGSQVETYPAVLEDFTRDTGIDVTFKRASASEIHSTALAEHASGKTWADVLSMNDPKMVKELLDTGVIQEVELPIEAEIRAAAGDNPTLGYAKPTTLAFQGIGINTALVSDEEAPTSLKDLADPKWKDAVGLASVKIGVGALSSGKHLYDALGPEGLKELGANNPKIYPSTIPLIQALAKGEIKVGIADLTVLGQVAEEGNPLRWIEPEEGAVGFWMANSLSGTTERPNCAKIYMSWTSSKAGAASSYEHDGFLHLRNYQNPPEGAPEVDKVTTMDPEWLQANRESFIEEFSAVIPQP